MSKSHAQLRADNRALRRENKALARELAACKASVEKQKEKDRAKLWRLIETMADSVAPAIGIADQWEEATMDGFAVGMVEWNRLRRQKVELEKRIATAMGVSVVALGGVEAEGEGGGEVKWGFVLLLTLSRSLKYPT